MWSGEVRVSCAAEIAAECPSQRQIIHHVHAESGTTECPDPWSGCACHGEDTSDPVRLTWAHGQGQAFSLGVRRSAGSAPPWASRSGPPADRTGSPGCAPLLTSTFPALDYCGAGLGSTGYFFSGALNEERYKPVLWMRRRQGSRCVISKAAALHWSDPSTLVRGDPFG